MALGKTEYANLEANEIYPRTRVEYNTVSAPQAANTEMGPGTGNAGTLNVVTILGLIGLLVAMRVVYEVAS